MTKLICPLFDDKKLQEDAARHRAWMDDIIRRMREIMSIPKDRMQ